jgi:hypothetical protein
MLHSGENWPRGATPGGPQPILFESSYEGRRPFSSRNERAKASSGRRHGSFARRGQALRPLQGIAELPAVQPDRQAVFGLLASLPAHRPLVDLHALRGGRRIVAIPYSIQQDGGKRRSKFLH